MLITLYCPNGVNACLWIQEVNTNPKLPNADVLGLLISCTIIAALNKSGESVAHIHKELNKAGD